MPDRRPERWLAASRSLRFMRTVGAQKLERAPSRSIVPTSGNSLAAGLLDDHANAIFDPTTTIFCGMAARFSGTDARRVSAILGRKSTIAEHKAPNLRWSREITCDIGIISRFVPVNPTIANSGAKR
jgi:hypothetical protein